MAVCQTSYRPFSMLLEGLSSTAMSAMFLRPQETEITSEAVVSAMANEHDRRILAATQEEPVDAQTIIEETGISKSTVYRRLDRLQEMGLLETADGRLRNGHAVDRYQARAKSISLHVRDGTIEATWTGAREEDAPSDLTRPKTGSRRGPHLIPMPARS